MGDVMLNYQSNSYHAAAALWKRFGLESIAEVRNWLAELGRWHDGRLTGRAGDPTIFT